ncbi:MAG: pseudouridine synthase [Proteobacteria bacterium]|nr:pseudouridine synthase [Pseudomonadota bacterium]
MAHPPPAPASLEEVLFSQGFGSRRACAALAPQAQLSADGHTLTVAGVAWPVVTHALVMLHKPAGYECSQRPGRWPSVLSLLPAPLRQRGKGGVQPVGRLDADTTGLLLLTDDGALTHRLTSPRRHVPKVYEVTCKHPVDKAQIERLLAGVVLHDDPAPVAASAAQATGTHTLRLTLAQGKYHQVKRMLAAVGNRVEGLHRSAFGSQALPADLAPGQWRWVVASDFGI